MIAIALFVYNRPEHTRRTIQALQSAYLSEEVMLYVFSDGPKGLDDVNDVNAVRSLCSDISGFAQANVVNRENNIGLAENIISGLNIVFSEYDRVVVLEDDLLVSRGYIKYMIDALEFYQDKGVFSVSGYTPCVKIPSDYQFSTYVIPRNCSWGWGTWREKWNSVDWDVKDFKHFIVENRLRDGFNLAGNDLTPMLLKQQMGLINSWSIRFTYAAFKCGEPSVYPVRSLVNNNGVDGSGTNMRKSRKYSVVPVDDIDSSKFVEELTINENILCSFRSFYDTSLIRRIINYFIIKLFIKSI